MEDGTPKETFTVDEALIATGFGRFQFWVLAYAGMGWISEAMEMMLLSFVGPAVQAAWGLSAHQESLITSVVFAGMLVGAYAWGMVSDKYGRRKGFFITAAVTSLAGVLSAFSPNYMFLLFFRCLVGVGLGGCPVLSSWFLEFIPSPNRGTWMVIFSAFWTVGTIFEASLAWLIMPSLGWRWLLVLSALPSFLLLIFYRLTPESPRYLCMKGRMEAALGVLKEIARLNGSELPSGILVSDNHIHLREKSTVSEDTNVLSPKANEVATSKSVDQEMSEVGTSKSVDQGMSEVGTSKSVDQGICEVGTSKSVDQGMSEVGTSKNVDQGMSEVGTSKSVDQGTSGVGTSKSVDQGTSGVGTSKSVDQGTSGVGTSKRVDQGTSGVGTSKSVDQGVSGFSSVLVLLSKDLIRPTFLLWVVFFGNAFSYYGLVLLTTELSKAQNSCSAKKAKLHESKDISYRNVFITSFAEFPGLLIAAAIVDRIGRKLSMASTLFLCCVFLLPLVRHQPAGLTTALLFGGRACISACFTIVFIYAPEIYPTSVRTTGVGIASSVGRIGGMVCPLVAVALVHGCHGTVALILFEVIIFASGFCALLFPFETKGRKLVDAVSSTRQSSVLV